MSGPIVPIVMPKWGLSMKEGKVVDWLVEEGDTVSIGDEVAEVETDKIDGAVEATDGGVLRRLVAEVGRTYRVRALLGVLADPSVPDEEIDAFVAEFPEPEGDGEDGEAAIPYERVELDGIDVRYARQGGGERTVVLLHGFGGDLDNWLFNLGPLADDHDVVALDLPGHGESTLALPGTTLAALAEFVVGFLDRLDVRRADLVGHSMGAGIAARLVIDHPDRVRSLALVAPAGFGAEIDGEYVSGFAGATAKRDVKRLLGRLYADDTLVTRSVVDGVLRYKRLDGVDELLTSLADGLFPGGRQADVLVEDLADRDVPILVIWGRDDRLIPADQAGAAPERATTVVLDEAGHMVQMEQAAEVNRLLLEHLART